MSKEKRIPTQEMVQYRERLIKQKEFLTDLLSKIEKQILALQVERLHLKNTLLGSECQGADKEILSETTAKNDHVKTEPIIIENDPKSQKQQQLDLSVPALNDFEEEVEDDEITEDEKRILNQLDSLI